MTFDGTNKVKIKLPEELKNPAATTEDEEKVQAARTQSVPTGGSMRRARASMA